MRHVIIFLSLTLMASFAQAGHHEAGKDDKKQHAVLVTGASSGIGLRMTEVLAANGFVVYAGARKDADLKRLNAMDNVESVRLDVTKQEEIDAAVEFVESRGRGLYGLINNAGIAIVGPVTDVPVDELDWQLNVNVLGPYRVTQAFAPLIIESKGRITTTGSISGILSGPLFSQYSMSKHAIEAFTDSLAVEMARFDVKVSVIEPGSFQSNIGQTFAKRAEAKGYIKEGSPFAADMKAMADRMTGFSEGKDPLEVANAALHFMSAEQPKHRYMVVPGARQADITIRQILREMVQLNHDQEYSFSEEELVKMMQEVQAELAAD